MGTLKDTVGLGAAEGLSPSIPVWALQPCRLQKPHWVSLRLSYDLLREPQGDSDGQKEELGRPARMLGPKASRQADTDSPAERLSQPQGAPLSGLFAVPALHGRLPFRMGAVG